MTRRQRFLGFIVATFAMAAAMFVAYPFLDSLRPNEVAKDRSVLEIPIDDLSPGEYRRVESIYGEVWAVRRTDQEIQWLQSNPGPLLSDLIPEQEALSLPAGVDPGLRSSSPEWFIFSVSATRDRYLFREGPRGSYGFSCRDLVRFYEKSESSRGEVFMGGFRCADQEQAFPIFNLAGRSDVTWVWPLRVPKHRIKRGKVFIGPAI